MFGCTKGFGILRRRKRIDDLRKDLVMRQPVRATLLAVVAVVLGALPASASMVPSASPAGGDTNPLGTLRWLPDNAN